MTKKYRHSDHNAADVRAKLLELMVREFDAMQSEPPPENLWMEIAFWRASYKIAVENTSLKASASAHKSNATKRARLKVGHKYLQEAISKCENMKIEVTIESLLGQLAELNCPEVYSDEKYLQKRALVKPGTVRAFLKDWRLRNAKT